MSSCKAGIIAQNIRLAPAVGQQADHEFEGKPCPADDRLAGEDLRVECDARVLRPSYPAAWFMQSPTALGSVRIEGSPRSRSWRQRSCVESDQSAEPSRSGSAKPSI